MTDTTYSITDLAREFGLTTRAIRFYEDHGLLAPKRAGRTRVYGHRDRVRLKLTVRGKRLGFSLVQIRELIDMYDSTGDDHAQLERFLQVLEKRRAILQQQREDIEAVLGEIDAFERQCHDLLARKKEKGRGAGESKHQSLIKA
ncbi:MAG TPA: MerR family DNA-binding transcriptional regulator [Burkholderiales bacterium]|jgi:DNA-binding transcriptional MerR regulator|nr:MerR family DNA-binding transcriptional regulator [Burkholderiales bacterium]